MDGFVMTDRELAESVREREARTRAMLAEADYTAYLETQAAVFATEEGEPGDAPALPLTIECGKCIRGRIVTEEFDGRTGRACPDCKGTGELALTAEESAIVGQFLAACRIAVAAVPAPVPLYPRLAA